MSVTKSNDFNKGLNCIETLTLQKALMHVKVDEGASFQVEKFSFQPGKDKCLKESMFGMKLHVSKKELCLEILLIKEHYFRFVIQLRCI